MPISDEEATTFFELVQQLAQRARFPGDFIKLIDGNCMVAVANKKHHPSMCILRDLGVEIHTVLPEWMCCYKNSAYYFHRRDDTVDYDNALEEYNRQI